MFYGSVTLPIKSGTSARSFHSIRMKGLRAEKTGKVREKDTLVTAPAWTPCSVSARKALCLALSRTTFPSGKRPHKLAPSKSDERPAGGKEGIVKDMDQMQRDQRASEKHVSKSALKALGRLKAPEQKPELNREWEREKHRGWAHLISS